MMRSRSLFRWIAAFLALAGGALVSSGQPIEPIGHEISYTDELPTNAPPFEKALALLHHADWAHDWVFYKVQRQLEWFDGLYVPKMSLKQRVPNSRFRIGLFGEIKDRNTVSFKFDPDFDMDLNLPNLEDRFNLFITTEELDELPGTDPLERDHEFRFGLHRQLRKYFDLDVGIRARTPPEFFTKLKVKRFHETGPLTWYPGVQGFWDSDEGLGAKGVVSVDRWFGRGLVRSTFGARITEKSFGVEWDETLMAGYATELLEENKLGRQAGSRDIARGGGIRYTISGHDSSAFVVDRHRITVFYKFPLRKQWLYVSIAPELEFENERDWDESFGIKFGFDMLFWGMGDR